MKKLVTKLLVCVLAVFVVFGMKTAITNAYDAPTPQEEPLPTTHPGLVPDVIVISEANADNEAYGYEGFTLWQMTNSCALGELPDECKPGSILKAGDKLSFSHFIFDFDYAMIQYYYLDDPSAFNVQCNQYGAVTSVAGATAVSAALDAQPNLMLDANEVTVGSAGGYSSWKVAYVICFDETPEYDLFIILVPYEATPVNVDCTLVKSGNTTQWLSPEGKVVWTITEEEDKITADLTDWAAVNADGVKAWAESGKALNITYKYNGYTVTINVPAGELTDTGAEWYGPEYLAAVNQKYVVVKDSTGLVVPNDRIYKK